MHQLSPDENRALTRRVVRSYYQHKIFGFLILILVSSASLCIEYLMGINLTNSTVNLTVILAAMILFVGALVSATIGVERMSRRARKGLSEGLSPDHPTASHL